MVYIILDHPRDIPTGFRVNHCCFCFTSPTSAWPAVKHPVLSLLQTTEELLVLLAPWGVATMPLGQQAFGFVQEWGMGPNSWPCWKENDVINLQIVEGTVYTPYFQIFEIHLGRTWKEEAKHGLLNAGHHPLAH